MKQGNRKILIKSMHVDTHLLLSYKYLRMPLTKPHDTTERRLSVYSLLQSPKMALLSSLSPPAFALLISCTLLIHLSCTEAFTVDMFRYDSPKSPFYNPNKTDLDRFHSAAQHSLNRARYFGRAISSLSSQNFEQKAGQVTDAGGYYVLNVCIGTPPVEILAAADTGSDLIWTQCQPCSDCFRQDAPLFDPRRSETYRPVPCGSEACAAVRGTACNSNNVCQYTVSYGDKSQTNGVVSEDTITFGTVEGHPVTLPQTTFGCGYDNGGTFTPATSGIIGLGGGAASAVRQANSLIGGKFSYCLIPHGIEKASKLNFGDDGLVSGRGAVSTPLVNGRSSTFYTVTLESISVGNTTSRMSRARRSGWQGAQQQEGNIIVDSGTTLTFLPAEMYSQVEATVMQQVKLDSVEVSGAKLCYNYKAESLEEGFPTMTAHFGGGADIELKPYNTFLKVREGVWCLAILPAEQEQGITPIFGNVAMGNMLVGFDLNAKTVTFKPADCTNL